MPSTLIHPNRQVTDASPSSGDFRSPKFQKKLIQGIVQERFFFSNFSLCISKLRVPLLVGNSPSPFLQGGAESNRSHRAYFVCLTLQTWASMQQGFDRWSPPSEYQGTIPLMWR